MLDNLLNAAEPSESEILKRISAVRNPAPEGQPEIENVDEAVSDSEAPQEEESQEESQELESEQETESEELTGSPDDDDEESIYLDLDGREINLNDVRDWEQAFKDKKSMQADYTKKRMADAEVEKANKAKAAALEQQGETLQTLIASLEVTIGEQQESIDWDELREIDPSEYLKQKELAEKREKALKSAKDQAGQLSEGEQTALVQQEQQLLLQAKPEWLDPKGQPTKQYNDDMTAMNAYLQANGYTEQDTGKILDHKTWLTILKAAKYDSLSNKSVALGKKVKKAPLVTKPNKQSSKVSNIQKELETAQKRLKQTGSERDAMAVMKLKKQLRN